MIYAITYDLNKSGQNYSALYDTIKNIGEVIHPLQNLWFLNSSMTIDKITNTILLVIDQNDRLFVAEINKGAYQGWMDKDTWNWINQRL